jgi:small subunit ribosomal protein S17e
MGNSKDKFIKNIAEDIFKRYPQYITYDFSMNKAVVDELTDITSKRIRNKVAGRLVTLSKNRGRIITHPKGIKKRKGSQKKRFSYGYKDGYTRTK